MTFTIHTPTRTRRVWCFFSPYDIAYYAAQALHYVHPKNDLILLDGRTDPDFFYEVIRARNIPADNVFVASNTWDSKLPYHKHLVEHDLHALTTFLQRHQSARPDEQLALVPFQANAPTFVEMYHVLQRRFGDDLGYIGEDPLWSVLFGNKGIVHPTANGSSVWARTVGEVLPCGLRAPKGRLCVTAKDVRQTWRDWGCPDSLVLKEIESSGGAGVHFVHADKPPTPPDAKYALPQHLPLKGIPLGQAPIIVEEDLRTKHKRLDFLAIQYDASVARPSASVQAQSDALRPSASPTITLGPVIKQQFLKGNVYSGSHTIDQSSEVVQRIRKDVMTAVQRMRPTHRGGFDIAVGDDPNSSDPPTLYLLDVNSSRFNGTDTARALCSWKHPTAAHFTYFSTPSVSGDVRKRVRAAFPWASMTAFDGRRGRWVVVGDSVEQCATRKATLLREMDTWTREAQEAARKAKADAAQWNSGCMGKVKAMWAWVKAWFG